MNLEKLTLAIFILGGFAFGWLLCDYYSPQVGYFSVKSDSATQLREMASVSLASTSIECEILKTLTLKHTDGEEFKLHLAKIKNPTVLGFVTTDEQVFLDVSNYVPYKEPNATTTQQIPLMSTGLLIHELTHLTTFHNFTMCPSITDNVCQEKNAYDIEYIYEQIKTYDEDNIIRLRK